MDSILTSIKKMLGIAEEDTSFDQDLIIHINSVFMILRQLGVCAVRPIEDKETDWPDITNSTLLAAVKSYVYLKVRLLFDPPISSAAIEAINRQISELEWRINSNADYL